MLFPNEPREPSKIVAPRESFEDSHVEDGEAARAIPWAGLSQEDMEVAFIKNGVWFGGLYQAAVESCTKQRINQLYNLLLSTAAIQVAVKQANNLHIFEHYECMSHSMYLSTYLTVYIYIYVSMCIPTYISIY